MGRRPIAVGIALAATAVTAWSVMAHLEEPVPTEGPGTDSPPESVTGVRPHAGSATERVASMADWMEVAKRGEAIEFYDSSEPERGVTIDTLRITPEQHENMRKTAHRRLEACRVMEAAAAKRPPEDPVTLPVIAQVTWLRVRTEAFCAAIHSGLYFHVAGDVELPFTGIEDWELATSNFMVGGARGTVVYAISAEQKLRIDQARAEHRESSIAAAEHAMAVFHALPLEERRALRARYAAGERVDELFFVDMPGITFDAYNEKYVWE